MIKVPLRSLHRRIEKAIFDHNLESALSQCISILKYFPKNLDTYRLLGKVMLEKQDYLNAEKILSLILKVDPDDFVANLGMSIVSESKGDLDQAIRYMERSSELQPGNDAIQNEIKRLVLSRDGIDLNKVKLTRGTLINLYMQSDLVEQAIAEIRVGLHENPNRFDYKIALAKMLSKSGNNIDAVKTCIEIISQLPYCFQANQILDQILLSENKSKKISTYHHRLIELDPYYAFMTPDTNTIQDVPDIAVLINDEPDTPESEGSLDWDWMIRTIWDEEFKWQHESVIEDINWETIIQDAIDSNTNILETNTIENLSEPENRKDFNEKESTRTQYDSSPINKKALFLNKLHGGSSNIHSNSNIPGWIFDDNDQIDQNINDGNDSLLHLDRIEPEQKIDEPGMIDHDAPVEIMLDENQEEKANDWIKDKVFNEPEEQSDKFPGLEDTKQIRVGKVDDSELLVSCQKAIDGGNIRFAMENIQKLLDQHNQDIEIVHLLEEACSNHPDEIALWLKLGETYLKMDQKEKALDIFKKAESKIAL